MGDGLRCAGILLRGLKTASGDQMTEDKGLSSTCPALDSKNPFIPSSAAVAWFYAQAQASRWNLSREQFAIALERSTKKLPVTIRLAPKQLREFLTSLHVEDLALACACAEGCEPAWEHFVVAFRGYLRAAAAAILRCNAGSPEALEFADSLFTDLYGLPNAKGSRRSLFQYFHGRSSLKTWLRAVLAQRHIDHIRSGRRFEELDGDSVQESREKIPGGPLAFPADPDRERYTSLFGGALRIALAALDTRDAERLRLYYREEKTLAEIGRLLNEHESSVSRNLDRVRRALRAKVEEILAKGFVASNGGASQPGLSDAEISLCFEYVSQDVPIDLEKLFPHADLKPPAAGRQKP